MARLRLVAAGVLRHEGRGPTLAKSGQGEPSPQSPYQGAWERAHHLRVEAISRSVALVGTRRSAPEDRGETALQDVLVPEAWCRRRGARVEEARGVARGARRLI